MQTGQQGGQIGDLPLAPRSIACMAGLRLAVVAAIAGTVLLSACGQQSDSQQPPAQQQTATDEQSRKDADEKAWNEAVSSGTAAAFNSYIQNFGSGAHVSEARERVAALNEQARKQADEKAWADAQRVGTVAAYNTYIQNFASGAYVAEARLRITALNEKARKDADEKAWTDAVGAGTPAAFNGYIQNFSSGAHIADARQRVAALEAQARKEADDKAWADAQKAGTTSAYNTYLQNFGTGAYAADARRRVATLDAQGRREVPTVDIQKTCQAAAGVMVSLLGGGTTDQDVKGCLDSEQKAREQIIKDQATYSAVDKSRCMRTTVYLPSYVEWLTCLEMERDVRKMQVGQPSTPSTTTLPKVRPATNW